MASVIRSKRIVEQAVASHPIFEGVSAEVRARVLLEGRIQTFEPGELLSREGEPANDYWVLCSGSVRVYYSSPDGVEVTVKIFGAPAAWAEMEVLTGHAHIEDCSAVDRSTVLRLKRQNFEALLEASPRFMRNVLTDTCARFLIAAQHERALAFLSVKQRLANVLLMYVRMYGVPVKGGVGIRVKLSQGELANDLGVTKRSIARTLTNWTKQGLLRKSGTQYVVENLEALNALATQDIVGIDWVAGSRLDEGRGVRARRARY